MIDERTREIYGTGRVVSPRSLTEREAEDPYRGAPSTPYDVTPRVQPKPQDVYREVNPMFSTAYDEMDKLNSRSAASQARKNAMYQEVPNTAGYKALINRLGPAPTSGGGIEDRTPTVREQIRRAKMGFDVDHGSKQEKLAAQMGLQSVINGIYARANAQTNEYNRAGQDAYKLALADRTGQANTFLKQDQNQRETLNQLLRNAGYEQQNMLNYDTEQRRLDQAGANDAQQRHWENVVGTSGLMERYGQNWGDVLAGSLVGVEPEFLADNGTYGAEVAKRISDKNSASRLAPGKRINELLTAATATLSPDHQAALSNNSVALNQFKNRLAQWDAAGYEPSAEELNNLASSSLIMEGRMLYDPTEKRMKQVNAPLAVDQGQYNRGFLPKLADAVSNFSRGTHEVGSGIQSFIFGGEPQKFERTPGFNDVLMDPKGNRYYDFDGAMTEEQRRILGLTDPFPG